MRSYVLISGATGGLGKAFAAECAARGWNLFLTDLPEEALSAAAAGLEHVDRLGLRFHCLINVAGLDYEGPFGERKVGELRTIVRLNIESTVEMTRSILPFKDPARTLRIVNVSSLAAFYPMPVKAVYAASKRFLLDWSLALNQELRSSDVTVTALCPAGMPTTPACIRSIDAQGFMGRITTQNVGDVAARTIDRALAGRSVYVPGGVNRLLRLLGGMAPATVVALLINNRWRKSHEQSHAPAGALTPASSADRA